MKWKPDWPMAKENLIKWWRGQGLALCLMSPRDEPIEAIPEPAEPADMLKRWTDPEYRCSRAEYVMANTCFFAEAFPYFDTYLGPGSLGTLIGAEPVFTEATAWYEPCIDDPDAYGPIRFDAKNNKWWDVHIALIDEGLRRNDGRYPVGIPDMIENIDTLAELRGTEKLMFDLIEKPAWVQQKLAEINEAYFVTFDRMFQKVRDEDGGNAFCAFRIWGPGKTAKLQCDLSAMISTKMFDEFVVPHLTAQCEWLDYTMYHLDGEQALQHLDSLLAIEPLGAIEWTPVGASGQIAGMPSGGSPHWYELYRRIKAAGKAVQAIEVNVDEVVPLLDAVGPEGMFVMVSAPDQATGEKLLEATQQYR